MTDFDRRYAPSGALLSPPSSYTSETRYEVSSLCPSPLPSLSILLLVYAIPSAYPSARHSRRPSAPLPPVPSQLTFRTPSVGRPHQLRPTCRSTSNGTRAGSRRTSPRCTACQRTKRSSIGLSPPVPPSLPTSLRLPHLCAEEWMDGCGCTVRLSLQNTMLHVRTGSPWFGPMEDVLRQASLRRETPMVRSFHFFLLLSIEIRN